MTDFKQKLRGFFSDSSLFRRIYIIDLFLPILRFSRFLRMYFLFFSLYGVYAFRYIIKDIIILFLNCASEYGLEHFLP